MADIKKELYGIPAHLNVDKIKQNQNTYFADRTAMHIKTGLSEVEIEKSEKEASQSKEITKNSVR